MIYRSGLKHRPPLAHGGHCFTMIVKQQHGAPRGSLFAAIEARERPSVWCCVKCFWMGPLWAITEGFCPMPCMGGVAALAA